MDSAMKRSSSSNSEFMVEPLAVIENRVGLRLFDALTFFFLYRFVFSTDYNFQLNSWFWSIFSLCFIWEFKVPILTSYDS